MANASGHLGARIQGALYAFLHATVRHAFLGATIRGWLINLPLFMALFGLLLRWPIGWIITIVALDLVLRLLYWKAKRDGYVRFVSEATQQPQDGAEAVAADHKVAVKATGVFSVKDWEEYILARPAEYWRVPMGDHAVMVRHSSGRFLYQFVRLGTIQQVEAGLLCHGPQPCKALAITFVTNWGPDAEDVDFMFYAPGEDNDPPGQQRRLYLAFESEPERDSVWQNFLSNGRADDDQTN